MASDKLAKFLREVSNWQWDEFVRAEKNLQYSSNQAIILALIRSCAMQNLPAIKTALNRLDGKLKTPVRIEMPKVFYLYPNATLPEPTYEPLIENPTTVEQAEKIVEGELMPMPQPAPSENAEKTEKDLPSMGLRETLTEMGDYPRELPEAIIQLAEQTHQWVQKHAEKPDEIPMVKSVVAANLLVMAQKRNIDALTEVFDQIDGKLVETIQILGEDIYIEIYSSTAPPEAKLNADGIYQLEAKMSQDTWAEKLGGAK